MKTSCGFHTLSLSMSLLQNQAYRLMADFKRYSRETHLIKIQLVDHNGKNLDNARVSNLSVYETAWKIYFFTENRGMEWKIRRSQKPLAPSEGYLDRKERHQLIEYNVDVKINPKILAGIDDYITASTYKDMEKAISRFNAISQSISPMLQDFESYRLKRIDYCINFSLSELGIGCTPEFLMEMIGKSNIPSNFKKWTQYDDVSHRMKSKPGSFYLTNQSLNINCYSKFMELQERSRKRVENGQEPVAQCIMDAARDIIRFEVQFKYRKTYMKSHNLTLSGNTDINKYEDLLNDDTCFLAVSDYYRKTIGYGDWYSLQGAIKRIKSLHYNRQKENRLIEALQYINQCRSLSVAKCKLKENRKALEAFMRTLSDLEALSINPVTIPKEKGIPFIPNPYRRYGELYSDKQSDNIFNERGNELVEEFFSHGGTLSELGIRHP